MTKPQKAHQTSLRFSEEDWRLIQELSEKLRIPIADLLRALLIEYAQQHKAKPHGLAWPPRYVAVAMLDTDETGKARLVPVLHEVPAARSSKRPRGAGLIIQPAGGD